MISSQNANRIYLGAAAISCGWAVLGFFQHWPTLYLLGEVGFAGLMLLVWLIARERQHNAVRRAERKSAQSIYRQRKKSRQSGVAPRAIAGSASGELQSEPRGSTTVVR